MRYLGIEVDDALDIAESLNDVGTFGVSFTKRKDNRNRVGSLPDQALYVFAFRAAVMALRAQALSLPPVSRTRFDFAKLRVERPRS